MAVSGKSLIVTTVVVAVSVALVVTVSVVTVVAAILEGSLPAAGADGAAGVGAAIRATMAPSDSTWTVQALAKSTKTSIKTSTEENQFFFIDSFLSLMLTSRTCSR